MPCHANLTLMNVPEKHTQQEFAVLEPELPGVLALFSMFHPDLCASGLYPGATTSAGLNVQLSFVNISIGEEYYIIQYLRHNVNSQGLIGKLNSVTP